MKNKYICIFLVSLVVFIMANKGEGKDSIDLRKYQWKNRLLLLFAPSPHEADYAKLKQDLSSQAEEVRDRDLLVFHILASGETKLGNVSLSESSGDYLREKFFIKSGVLTTLLIGKDGGVKLRSQGPVELEEIFSLIDAMPMRQREMRDKS
jgi:hypothetical protein